MSTQMSRAEFIAKYGIGPGGTFVANDRGGNAASEVAGLSAADYYDKYLDPNAAPIMGFDGQAMASPMTGSGKYENSNPNFSAWDNVNPHPESNDLGGFGEFTQSVLKPAAMMAAMYGGVTAAGGLLGGETAAMAPSQVGAMNVADAGVPFALAPEAAIPSIAPLTAAEMASFGGGTAGTFGAGLTAAGKAASAAAAAGGGSGLLGGVGKFLKDNPTLTQLGGAALGALAGQDKTATTSSTKDPWAPAQPYLLDNLKNNAKMQEYYSANPFSDMQKSAYQGLLDSNANAQANVSGLLANASNFGKSSRGVMPGMQGLLSGVTAPPIDWSQYTAWRK